MPIASSPDDELSHGRRELGGGREAAWDLLHHRRHGFALLYIQQQLREQEQSELRSRIRRCIAHPPALPLQQHEYHRESHFRRSCR
jgi:hypothetical protein